MLGYRPEHDLDVCKAEICIKKAIDLSKGADIRMQITLARVQIAKKDYAKARVTLRALSKRVEELSESDKAEFDRLDELAKGNGKAKGGK